MKPFPKLALTASCALMGFFGNISSAAVTTYTTRSALEAALELDYFQNFTAYTGGTMSASETFTSGGLNYTISAQTPGGNPSVNGLYGEDGTLGTASGNDSLIITFNTDTYGFGGQFYFVSFDGSFASANLLGRRTNLTITFNDNSTYVVPEYAPSSIANSYRGFVVDDGRKISKLTFSAGSPQVYATVDNFTVGYNTPPIPEPGSFALIAGIAGIGCFVFRRRVN